MPTESVAENNVRVCATASALKRVAIGRSLVVPVLFGALLLSACGGGSDSGAGGGSTTQSPAGQTPANGGGVSLNNAASGIYESTMRVTATGAGSDYTARIRVVIDQGGGASIWENGQLQGQARLVSNGLSATRTDVVETLFGRRCRGDRRYQAVVSGGNQRVEGSLSANYNCDGAGPLALTGTFSLPRTGDHQ